MKEPAETETCIECNKPRDKDKLELCSDGKWRCFPCINFEINFGDEK